MARSSVAQTDIPPGALVTFLQKGLEYISIEENINEDGTIKDFDGSNLSLLSPFICDSIAVKEERRGKRGQDSSAAEDGMEIDGPNENQGEAQVIPSTVVIKNGQTGSKLLHLLGHQGEVFMCVWNPMQRQLASGSADGMCRLWGLWEMDANKWDSKDGSEIKLRTSIMSHSQFVGERFKDVTSVTWSPCGQYLATGCYDGIARIWDNQGALKIVLKEHTGTPLFIYLSSSITYSLTRLFRPSFFVKMEQARKLYSKWKLR